MSRLTRRRLMPMCLLSACLLGLSVASIASAELPWSRIEGLVPAGAKAGSTIQLRLSGGAELAGITSLRFSHAGITGTRIPDSSPAENLFEVRVAADVPPGLYDVSALGDLGLSNLRTFAVSELDDISEAEPNDAAANATTAALPCVLNGRIGKATDVDAYSFRASAGQKIVANCLAARIDSPLLPVMEILDGRGRRLAFARAGRDDDAVLFFEPPHDGDYVLRIYDQTYRGGDDYVYRLELGARPYVIAVQPVSGQAGSTSPAQVLGLNLPGAKPSDQRWGRWLLDLAEVSIAFPETPFDYDRILPVSPREAAVDSFSWRELSSDAKSQPVRITVGAQAPIIEVEPNQVQKQAQALTLPAEVSGDFRTVGDTDLFRCEVQKDQPIWIEVFADRIGSRADVSLVVEFQPEGAEAPQRVAAVDDSPASLLPVGFETQTDDPVYRFVPPGNGTCLIQLRDQYGQTRGDPTLAYRLVVRPPQPDFRLVAVPRSKGIGMVALAALRKGDSLEFALLAFRIDGFDGAIEVPATDLGDGLYCEGTIIPPGQHSAPLVIRSRIDAPGGPRLLVLTGRARLTAQAMEPAIHSIRPATTIRNTRKVQSRDVAAAVRLARDWTLAIADEEAPFELNASATRYKVAQGSLIEVPLQLTRRAGAEAPVTIKAREIPKDAKLEVADITIEGQATEKKARVVIRPDAPARTVGFNFVASSKVQYRRHAAQRTQAQLALDAATQKLKEAVDQSKAAETAAGDAARALANAQKNTNDTTVDPAALEAASAAATQRMAESAAKVKTLEAERAAAEKSLQNLDQPAKELDFESVTSPLIVEVVPAPVALDPGGGKEFTVSVGQSLSIPVKFQRQNGFDGPVEVALAIPSTVTGLSATAVTAAKDVTEVQLLVQAAPDAPQGAYDHVSIQARCGDLHVATPILLKVVP